MSVCEKIVHSIQRNLVNLTNDYGGNELNYNNDLPLTGNKNYALQQTFETDFFTRFDTKLFATIIYSLIFT